MSRRPAALGSVLAAAVMLTTTWSGKSPVDEDPSGTWIDIDGTAVTTTSTSPFDVVDVRSRLVDD